MFLFLTTWKTVLVPLAILPHAYVIAHEVGHHVQHLMGITDKIDAQRGRLSETEHE